MRSLFPFFLLFRHHTSRLLLGIILAITSLSASIGLLSLSGWFLAASALVGSSLLFNFFYPSSGVRGLAIGRTISRYFERLASHDATFRVLADLRVTVFRRLLPQGVKLNRYRHSELLNRLVADVDTLDTLYLNLLSPFVSAVMVILFIGIGLSFISPLLMWVVCGTLAGLLLLLPLLFYRLGQRIGLQAVRSRSEYRSQFIEWIGLNAEFLLFGVASQKATTLMQTEKKWQQAQSQESQLGSLSNALLILVNGILVCVVIFLSSVAIHVPSAENPEALIALVVFCVLASLEILTPIGIAFLHLGQVVASAERLHEITRQTPSVEFNGHATWQKIMPNQPLIVFEHVHFRYEQGAELILTGLDLQIRAGQKVAILGKTGSGKSTLFQLLTRAFDVEQGKIYLNGEALENYPEAILRAHCVTLSQRVHIFSGTLAENLRIGDPDASDQALLDVLAKVGLSYLTEQDGLALWLGDGGRQISGGEQRRLGLARVLLSQAEIILLDEPTEALDRDTEQQILSVIFEHCQDRTLVMITHRLQGLAAFDSLYQLDAGRLQVYPS